MNVVMIEWLDSTQPVAEWRRLSDYEGLSPVHCFTVGFLIEDNQLHKVVALSMAELADNPQAAGVCCIPSSAVLAMTELPYPEAIFSSSAYLELGSMPMRQSA